MAERLSDDIDPGLAAALKAFDAGRQGEKNKYVPTPKVVLVNDGQSLKFISPKEQPKNARTP